MKSLKLGLFAMILALPFAVKANAQVAVGIGVGPAVVEGPADYGPPVCDWGYYPYYPYTCAPYGYYGPNWLLAASFWAQVPGMAGAIGMATTATVGTADMAGTQGMAGTVDTDIAAGMDTAEGTADIVAGTDTAVELLRVPSAEAMGHTAVTQAADSAAAVVVDSMAAADSMVEAEVASTAAAAPTEEGAGTGKDRAYSASRARVLRHPGFHFARETSLAAMV